MLDKVIDEIYSHYVKHGYVTESHVFEAIQRYEISLLDVDRVLELLLAKGVIIRDEMPDTDEESDDEYDKAKTDYEAVFVRIESLEPQLADLMSYIRTIKPPQFREWNTLLPQAQNGNKFARTRIFEMYMRSTVKIALQFAQKYEQPISDTIQNGFIGLYLAIDKFEFGKQDVFPQYYPFWVMQQIRREAEVVNPTVYYPVHAKDKLFSIFGIVREHYCDECSEKSICPCLVEEVSSILECDAQEAAEYIMALTPFESLDEMYDDDTMPHIPALEELHMFEDIIDRKDLRIIVQKELEHLKPKEKLVLEHRFGLDGYEERTLEEVGKILGVTRERVRQIESKALRRLGHPARSKKLKSYW